jgi:hypothetical protein
MNELQKRELFYEDKRAFCEFFHYGKKPQEYLCIKIKSWCNFKDCPIKSEVLKL